MPYFPDPVYTSVWLHSMCVIQGLFKSDSCVYLYMQKLPSKNKVIVIISSSIKSLMCVS